LIFNYLLLEFKIVFWSVGAKANVLHCFGFERWYAALLMLLKGWFYFISSFIVVPVF
jgi:hypothetical protein